ncbi:MAG: type II secretion system F family protein [Bacteroidetes bacterium]|nr:type II secretion system F family protein [Bacteroidota bacterium]
MGLKDSKIEWGKNLSFNPNKKFKDKKRYQFFNELAILIQSGLDLKTSLEISLENEWKKNELESLHQILKSVVTGKDLWESLKISNCFEPYEYYSIQIGESTGQLGKVLLDLSNFIKKRIEQKKKLTSAVSYPAFVLSIAVLAVFFMMKFIVPMFKDVFERFGTELPAITKLIISISEFIGHNFIYFLLLVILIIILDKLFIKEIWYKSRKSNFILKIPFAGELYKQVQLAKFFLAFEILSSSKVSILSSLKLLENMFEFYPLQIAIKKISELLIKGTPINEAFLSSNFFDKKTIALIRVGEEVNQLDLVLKTLREHYSQDVDYKMGMISSILEPLLIVVLGGIIGLILISMYLPLFKLSTSFQM